MPWRVLARPFRNAIVPHYTLYLVSFPARCMQTLQITEKRGDGGKGLGAEMGVSVPQETWNVT